MTKVNCEGCNGKCCRQPNVYIPLDEESEKRIPEELKTVYNGRPAMRSGENGCAALDGSGRCSIHSIAPLYCMLWPIMLRARAGVVDTGVSVDMEMDIEPHVVQCEGRSVPTDASSKEIIAENAELIEKALESPALVGAILDTCIAEEERDGILVRKWHSESEKEMR